MNKNLYLIFLKTIFYILINKDNFSEIIMTDNLIFNTPYSFNSFGPVQGLIQYTARLL